MAYSLEIKATSGADADGVDNNSATATVINNGTFVPTKNVKFSLSDSALFDNGENIKTEATDALGRATVKFTDTISETVIISCAIYDDNGNVLATAKDESRFGDVSSKYILNLDAEDGIPANGQAKSLVKATLLNKETLSPVPNAIITFKVGGDAFFSENKKQTITSTTDYKGEALTYISDSSEEKVSLSAVYTYAGGAIESTRTVEFGNAQNYSIVVHADDTALANGYDKNKVTVALFSRDEDEVSDKIIELSVSGHALFSNGRNILTANTDSKGKIAEYITDNTGEVVTITATYKDMGVSGQVNSSFRSEIYSVDTSIPTKISTDRDRVFSIYGLINGTMAGHLEKCVSNFHVTVSYGILIMYDPNGSFSENEYSGKGIGNDNDNDLILNLHALSSGNAKLLVTVDFVDGTKFMNEYSISVVDNSQSVVCRDELTFIEKFSNFEFTKGGLFRIKYLKSDDVDVYMTNEDEVFDSLLSGTIDKKPGMSIVADYVTLKDMGSYYHLVLRSNINGRISDNNSHYSLAYLSIGKQTVLTISHGDVDPRDKYPWTEVASPLVGVPMLDNGNNGDLAPEFFPRESYTEKLKILQDEVAENHRNYYLSKITKPTNEQISNINRLVYINSLKYSEMFSPDSVGSNSAIDLEAVKLAQLVAGYADKHIETEFPDPDLAKYDNQFKAFPKPDTARFIYDDDIFAYWRVAGCNPLALHSINAIPTNFPLTNEQYQKVMGIDDDLESAIMEHRVYMLDYKNLDGAMAEKGYSKPESATSPDNILGYSYLAMALFSVSKETKQLKSVAIQCGQESNETNPIFLALSDDDNKWGWQQAKMVIQAADKTQHQLSSHLGLTHLLCEAFALATIRNLRAGHPVYNLLISHFEGTNRINHNATLQLLGPRQFVDNLIAAPLGSLAKKVIDIRLEYDFYENFLPTELKNRGVDDIEALPDYPYRDDGLLIWNAIKSWVSDYLEYYYDKSIVGDEDLAAWMDDLVDNAKIKGFRKVTLRDELVDIITMIIFTSTAQHAAVNFPQHDWMMYSPAMIGTLAKPKPDKTTGNTKQAWLDMLPGENRSMSRLDIYTLLGRLHNGYLGEYVTVTGEEIFAQDKDPEIYNMLLRFNQNLDEIAKTISNRNLSRLYPYTILIPENIPSSINI